LRHPSGRLPRPSAQTNCLPSVAPQSISAPRAVSRKATGSQSPAVTAISMTAVSLRPVRDDEPDVTDVPIGHRAAGRVPKGTCVTHTERPSAAEAAPAMNWEWASMAEMNHWARSFSYLVDARASLAGKSRLRPPQSRPAQRAECRHVANLGHRPSSRLRTNSRASAGVRSSCRRTRSASRSPLFQVGVQLFNGQISFHDAIDRAAVVLGVDGRAIEEVKHCASAASLRATASSR
jgi:hypothetical protein